MTKFASKLGAFAIAAAVIVSATGVAGAQTVDLQAQIAALMAQIAALQAQTGTSTATGSSYTFTRDLTVGSTGQDVKELQMFLNANGYTVSTSGAGSVGSESTYFGNATKAALIKFQAAKAITPSAGYFGAKTRAYIATMGGTTTTPTTPVVTTSPLSVKLASDNAASANVQKGSANNAVLKFTLTGAADVATSITGLTVKSYGTTESTGVVDVSKVKLYDENGLQIGNDRTPAGNQLNFVIVPALTIPAGGSRTVTLTADIGSAGNTMAIVRYGIESAAGITGGATFAGTYPLIGNSFTIVPAGQLGTISVGQFGSLPKTSVKVGEKDVVLERFNVSAGSNEDVALNQITVTKSGNAGDSAVSNVRLRKVGETAVLAGPVSFSNKKATFNLTTTVNLVKGSSVNLEVVADIVDGTASPIAAVIAAGGAVGRGANSGTNITSTGATTANNITIGNETLTVSMSASHPQGADSYIIKTTNKKDLAKFDVRANGGDVILNTILVQFVDATDALTGSNYVSSAGLYDGDSLVSDLVTVDDENNQTFSLNYTIPANTTKTLTVKGITNTVTAAGDAFTSTWSGYTGYGLASGEAVTSAADVSSTAITIYASGTTTNTADTTKTPYSQGILAPSNGVTIAALKMYAQREDMKLTDITIKTNGTALNDENDISSITLYADDGVTALTNPVAFVPAASQTAAQIAQDGAVTADVFAFTTSDFINDIVVTKGVYKTVLVKANVATGIDGATAVTATIPNAAGFLSFDGQDSGTAYDAAAVAGVTFKITSPYAGGEFSGSTKIVGLTKASTSPSGSIARGTQSVTGIWDVNNYDSTNADAIFTSIKFTSKTGLPSVLDNTDNTDDNLFVLYDGEGNKLAGGLGDGTQVVLDKTAGTVTFAKAAMLTVSSGAPKQLKLVVDTTSTSKFASNTQVQWSVEAVGDATVTGGFVGYAAGMWSIPAVANVVTLP
ncbi:MAG: peptidoglycan-binding domain-containing protein [Candidatus Colwellbacteria bacterium]|nr:peptidoglycan-binding domain-containing protein [Candidatus Colwellbacteria bacterium]